MLTRALRQHLILGAIALGAVSSPPPRAARAADAPPAEVRALVESVNALKSDPAVAAKAEQRLTAETETAKAALKKLDGEIAVLGGASDKQRQTREGLTRRIEALGIALGLLKLETAAIGEPNASAAANAKASAPAQRAPAPAAAFGPAAAPEIVALFKDRVLPIFEESCKSCHHPGRTRGGLDITTREALLKGGDKGPAIVPGDSKASLLYTLVAHIEQPFMPHKEDKLPDADVEAIRKWIDGGAPFADAPAPAAVPAPAAPAAANSEAPKPAAPEPGAAPAEAPKLVVPPAAAAAGKKPVLVVTDEDRKFWSFQPLHPVAPPEVDAAAAAWAVNPIDRFVFSAMKAKELSPAPEADRRTLARRVYFDLIGLPPTPEQIAAFAADEDPDAYAELVDRLLASPQFGERWGRHWLDLARYADSGGYEFDYDRPTAFPYRDFVIQAFNDDLPYDTFVKWQLAGDEIAPDDARALIATGFIAAGPSVDNQESEQLRYDELDDVLSTTGLAMLGLTVGCARCHDHKYDPIPQRDYYKMLSAFTTTKRVENFLAPIAKKDELKAREDGLKKEIDGARKRIDEVYNPVREPIRLKKIEAIPADEADEAAKKTMRAEANADKWPKDLKKFKDRVAPKPEEMRAAVSAEDRMVIDLIGAKIAGLEKKFPPKVLTMIDDKAEPAENWLLGRGDPGRKLEPVKLGFLSVLTPPSSRWADAKVERPEGARSTLQRRALAEWITDADQGAGALAARVMVNRIWGHMMGKGIVATPSDFGAQGERPTQPEALDWLAAEFIKGGWSVKSVVRRLALSETYREGSAFNGDFAKIDPANNLLWRRTPRRLEAEEIRDAMLAATGCLNLKMFGPGVHVKMHPDAIATGSTAKWPKIERDGPETWRRGIYVYMRRSVLEPMLESFDGVSAAGSCARRMTTTVPSQALALLNSDFAVDQSTRFAERLAAASDKPDEWVRDAYRIAVGRAPEPHETQMALAFLQRQADRYGRAPENGDKNAGKNAGKSGEKNGDKRDDKNDDQGAVEPMRLALGDFCQVVLNLNEFVYID